MAKTKPKGFLVWEEFTSNPQWRSAAAKCLVSFFLNLTVWVCAGLVIKFLEGGLESTYKCGVKRVRRDFIDTLWNETILFDEQTWKSSARRRLIDFENELHEAVDAGIHTYSGQTIWSTRNAITYVFSLATTIGFGRLFPTTVAGKLFTICYMAFGNAIFIQLVVDISRLLSSSFMVLQKESDQKDEPLNFKTWNEILENNLFSSLSNCNYLRAFFRPGSILFCFTSWLATTSTAYITIYQVNPVDAIFSVMSPTATVGYVKNDFDDTSFFTVNSINLLLGTSLYFMTLFQIQIFMNDYIKRKLSPSLDILKAY